LRSALVLKLLMAGAVSLSLTVAMWTRLASARSPRAEADPPAQASAADGGLTELVADKYRERYEEWKGEYLSTQTGRAQWERYARDANFALTVTVSPTLDMGAEAGEYRWDSDGRLIAATITLGARLDSGFPGAPNYPITCSLNPVNMRTDKECAGKVLAATKLAHEFGHVNHTAELGAVRYQTQNRLRLEYNQIFTTNGFNARDPRLDKLTAEMGGTPVEIARAREHRAEACAALYLLEKAAGKDHAALPASVRRAVKSYLQAYPELLR
jgi:hypothetical protein